MATFNGIDYAVFIIIFLSIAMGILRGFVKEIIALAAWVAAFVVATLYAVPVAGLFVSHADKAKGLESISTVAIIISYLCLFFGILICGAILKFLAGLIVEKSGIGMTNRLFGALLGFARGCVLVVLAMFFLAFTALSKHDLWKESKMVEVFKPGVQWTNKMAQPYLAVIEAKMKKSMKGANEEELQDVIKPKAPSEAPVIPVTAPKNISAPGANLPINNPTTAPSAAPTPATLPPPPPAPAAAPAPAPTPATLPAQNPRQQK